MKFLKQFPFRFPGKRSVKKSSIRGRSELAVQLDLAERSKREIEKRKAEILGEIGAIPGRLRRIEENERRKIKDRATNTPTIRDPGRAKQKLYSLPDGISLTRSQKRILKNRLILLCVVFALGLIILWRTVR